MVWASNAYTRIYVNGRLGCDDASPYSGVISNSATWYIGRDRTDGSRMFDGMMDDITIWTNALTEAQIQELYKLGIHGWDASYLNNEPTGNDVSFIPYTEGLKVWLDGNDVDGQNNATFSDGDAVSNWFNKAGGSAGNAVTGLDTTNGTFKTGLDSKNSSGVRLNGTDEAFMLNEFMGTNTTFSFFAVIKNTGGTGHRMIFSDSGGSDTRNNFYINTADGSVATRDGNNYNFSSPPSTGTQLANNEFKLVETIVSEITKLADIENVHHIHIWQLDEKNILLEAHILFKKDVKISEFSSFRRKVSEILKKYGINHYNLQPEFEILSNRQNNEECNYCL